MKIFFHGCGIPSETWGCGRFIRSFFRFFSLRFSWIVLISRHIVGNVCVMINRACVVTLVATACKTAGCILLVLVPFWYPFGALSAIFGTTLRQRRVWVVFAPWQRWGCANGTYQRPTSDHLPIRDQTFAGVGRNGQLPLTFGRCLARIFRGAYWQLTCSLFEMAWNMGIGLSGCQSVIFDVVEPRALQLQLLQFVILY